MVAPAPYNSVAVSDHATSGADAGRKTGLTKDVVYHAAKDGKPRLGKGGHYYEFVDMSVPDDIDDFVEVRVHPELLQRKPAATVKRSYIGRSFVDTDTDERFTVCDVFNNYDINVDDHSLRLSLWFYDAKKYKKTPAKSQWDWCQVARMAADGYKFVDSSAPTAAKRRKTQK